MTKPFRFGRVRTSVNFDLYNLLNTSAVVVLNNNYAAWQVPQRIVEARLFKLSAQVRTEGQPVYGLPQLGEEEPSYGPCHRGTLTCTGRAFTRFRSGQLGGPAGDIATLPSPAPWIDASTRAISMVDARGFPRLGEGGRVSQNEDAYA